MTSLFNVQLDESAFKIEISMFKYRYLASNLIHVSLFEFRYLYFSNTCNLSLNANISIFKYMYLKMLISVFKFKDTCL